MGLFRFQPELFDLGLEGFVLGQLTLAELRPRVEQLETSERVEYYTHPVDVCLDCNRPHRTGRAAAGLH